MPDLEAYRQKRNFHQTPEPAPGKRQTSEGHRYLIQKHAARRLHYDLRLELDGVLKSWAVPKGPSLDPAVKSLAVHVEDHPLEYASFEGVIPAGQYGGGTVMLWDQGFWVPEEDPHRAYQKGKLRFRLQGSKLKGRWNLVRMSGRTSDDGKNWLLFKSDDDEARPASQVNVTEQLPRSVASGRTMEEIAAGADRRESSSAGSATSADSAAGRARQGPQKNSADPSMLPGSRKCGLPSSFQPQLATSVQDAPQGDHWLHELKFDGYRLLCRVENGAPRLLTRGGHDWTERFPGVARAVAKLNFTDAIIDGEVVVMAQDGTTDFQALQNLMKSGGSANVAYYAFDLPFFDGYDLTRTPLIERKQLLADLLAAAPASGVVRYSDHIAGGGSTVYRHACRYALEGVISKKADSSYEQRRSRSWVKSKCLKRQEFVIGGWTEPAGSRNAFGALLLGYYDQQRLIYCGRVGTGFTDRSLHEVKAELESVAADGPAFSNPPAGRGIHWVQPVLVAEIEFANWTNSGLLRQASFQGLREDKSPEQVIREQPLKNAVDRSPQRSSNPTQPKGTGADKRSRASASRVPRSTHFVAGVRLTSADRILYPDTETTKLDLAEFYEAIGDWILPHIVGRPITLVRCPKGHRNKCFYQKHLTESMPDQLRGVEISEKNETRTYVVVDDLPGLISLVQSSVLELHPWPARADRPDCPDRLVIDLDPGEEVSWSALIGAARDIRDRLSQQQLQSFVRTTGGKGLHVVAPLTGCTSWDRLKNLAKSLAVGLARDFPDRYTATASKAQRRGRIFIDYLRNQRGATAVASYSTRARPGATVATPIRWNELNSRMRPDRYHVSNLRNRLSALANDPWAGFFDLDQSL